VQTFRAFLFVVPTHLPLFLDLAGRRVLLVGGGPVAAAKLTQLLAARAEVCVVAPEVCDAIQRSGVPIERRPFQPSDLDDVWLAVAAAPPRVNRAVAAAAEARRVFVNAVDDPAHATAYLSGVVRRDGVTLAISTGGAAPGLTALLREALEAVLPRDLGAWLDEARLQRASWRADRVPIAERRPLLLKALNRLYAPDREGQEAGTAPDRAPDADRHDREPRLAGPSGGWSPAAAGPPLGPWRGEAGDPAEAGDGEAGGAASARAGWVALVGAGPGDPGLLTRRAAARLRAADLVLYDALVDRRVLALARRAQKFFVGKRAGRQAISQTAIHGLMIRAARRGKRVVRLKGGDPFVFGRGGEEARALAAAGIRFEVVPGVTSAIAAPELAGIPLTFRGVSSAFLVIGGHGEAFDGAIRSVVPNDVTLVVLMGLARRADIARRLLARGWRAGTPAAVVVDASMPTQACWTGTLADLAAGRAAVAAEGAGTLVIGEVVGVAAEIESAAADEPPGSKEGRHGSR